MKDLIKKFLEKLQQAREAANTELAKLKPLEQQEAAQELRWFFSSARNMVECLNQINEGITGKLTEFAEALRETISVELKADEAFRQEVAKDAKIVDLVKAQLLQTGDLVTKTDMDGKIEAAQKAKGEAVRQEIDAEIKLKEKLSGRRTEAATAFAEALKAAHGDKAAEVASALAAKLTDEVLGGDGYKTAISEVAGRLAECGKIGVTKLDTLQEVAGGSKETFDKLLSGWQEVAERASKGRTNFPLSTPASKGAGASSGEKPGRKMMF